MPKRHLATEANTPPPKTINQTALISAITWEMFRPAGYTLLIVFVVAWVLYLAICAGVSLLNPRWRERVLAVFASIGRLFSIVAGIAFSYAALALLASVGFHLFSRDSRSDVVLWRACILSAVLTLVIWSSGKFMEVLSKRSDTVGHTIERGRQLGTRAEARAAVRQQAGPVPQDVHLRPRGLMAAFLDALCKRRR